MNVFWELQGDPTGELLRSVVQGQVEDWDRLECTLHHVLYDQLGWEFDNEGSVLATEPLFASRLFILGVLI